jgi:hypothetical protein
VKLGMLTACLPDQTLDEIAAWAAQPGFVSPASAVSRRLVAAAQASVGLPRPTSRPLAATAS